MKSAKFVNIVRLMTTYNFEIEQLPENLKCKQCKLVLKDACQLPCCCRFCRACIDDIMTRGGEICPGDSADCGESLLSCFSSDHLANINVSKLSVKCPYDGCVHECQLTNMEEHLQECQRKAEDCPFRELGCTQDKLAAEQMGGHLRQENRSHSEILIGMIANINKDIDTLKHDLLQKDEHIRSIMDQLIHVQNENELIKNDIKSLKEDKEDLANRVRILLEEIEGGVAETEENDSVSTVIEYVDREITLVTGLIGSNKDELITDMQSLRGDIGSINQDIQSIKNDICFSKSQVQSIQVLMRLEQVHASCVWLIDDNVEKTRWDWPSRQSEYFSGVLNPYKYRLASVNYRIGTDDAELLIHLLIYAGPNDEHLAWPFEANVVISVTDRDRCAVYKSISRHCRIKRPADNDCSWGTVFKFLHSELTEADLNLSLGIRVSCVIMPGTPFTV